MTILKILLAILCTAAVMSAQEAFAVTGTPIPTELLKLNFGALPKGVQAYDLDICNLTDARHSLTSSEIFQALADSQRNLQPIGRDIMLAAILRNQNHSVKTWLSLGLTSTTGILSVVGTSHSGGGLSLAALGALIGQQLLSSLNPVLTADQVEKFEAQVLEPAIVMDGGSCVERTVFTTIPATPKGSHKPSQRNFEFQLR